MGQSANRKARRKQVVTKVLVSATLGALLFALSVSVDAQKPAKIPRIGYISGTGDDSNQGPYVEALRQGLRDLGYVDGKNILIEFRGTAGKSDRIPILVTELVQLKVDVLVAPLRPARSQAGDQDDSNCYGG